MHNTSNVIKMLLGAVPCSHEPQVVMDNCGINQISNSLIMVMGYTSQISLGCAFDYIFPWEV